MTQPLATSPLRQVTALVTLSSLMLALTVSCTTRPNDEVAKNDTTITTDAGVIASWLDEPTPASWNTPGAAIPAAPHIQTADSRCNDQMRPPQLEEDRRLREQGWDLVGAYQGGWQIVVIRATADYDGMCRPRQYQDFVFVHGMYAGTLSPHAMDSRTDGAISRVSLQSDRRLIAEYQRYAATDPLCCPSRTTSVMFDIGKGTPVLRPMSASTSKH